MIRVFRNIITALALLSPFAIPIGAAAQIDPQARGIATQARASAAAAQTMANTAQTNATAALATRNWKNLSEFGVNYGVNADQSAAVNAALASGNPINCTGTVYFNATLMITSGLTLQGNGVGGGQWWSPSKGCTFHAMSGMTADAVHMTSPGMLQGVTIRDVSIEGVSTNTGQNGVILVGQASSSVTGGQGGLWNSMFENVSIGGFDGVSFGMLGGCYTNVSGSNLPAPFQFISFKNLIVQRPNSTSGAALYMTGQVNHVHFDSSTFSGPSSANGGTDVYMGRPWGSACNVLGPLGTGTVFLTAAATPINIKFTNSSTENAAMGIIADDVLDVTFETHWAEQLNSFLLAQNNGNVTVIDSHITNAGLTGYVAEVTNCAEIEWINTKPKGTQSTGFTVPGCGSIHFSGTFGVNPVSNITLTTSQTGTNINLGTYSQHGLYLSCTTSGTSFSGFNSDLAPGELFMVKVNPASANPCILNSSGALSYLYGINLGNGVSTVSLNAGETAVLMRTAGPGYGFEYLGKH